MDDVYAERITAEQLLIETVRWLLLIRDEKRQRMATLLATLKSSEEETILAAEEIVRLIEQHLQLKEAFLALRQAAESADAEI